MPRHLLARRLGFRAPTWEAAAAALAGEVARHREAVHALLARRFAAGAAGPA